MSTEAFVESAKRRLSREFLGDDPAYAGMPVESFPIIPIATFLLEIASLALKHCKPDEAERYIQRPERLFARRRLRQITAARLYEEFGFGAYWRHDGEKIVDTLIRVLPSTTPEELTQVRDL